jgi:hypothetical protein
MTSNDGERRDFRIRGLTRFQSGIVFLLISTAILGYVGYQIHIGQVFTKSGQMPLAPGLPWAWLTLESVAAVVGVVRGLDMIRR